MPAAQAVTIGKTLSTLRALRYDFWYNHGRRDPRIHQLMDECAGRGFPLVQELEAESDLRGDIGTLIAMGGVDPAIARAFQDWVRRATDVHRAFAALQAARVLENPVPEPRSERSWHLRRSRLLARTA